ncbi:transmembrane protein 216 isoform X2 [Aplysia californica]|uniref:Transmembrane protein 216 isoform X2 n=1 Tax=Aplysia californica TaxID=6500 RepID=A0ABM0K5G9_APLCA|nr:transmembrane protein 216 isoform X2 [Aplysia californica]
MAAEQAQTSTQAPPRRGKSQVVRSSLPFQILLYLNGWYFVFFFVCEILLFVFKGETLPYASNVLAAEILLLFLLAIIEGLRLFFGRRGNLTEQIVGVIVFLVLSVPTIFGVLFFWLWQTYVLRAEVILTAIQIAFIGLEIIIGIISMITFAKSAV